jgi:spore protease
VPTVVDAAALCADLTGDGKGMGQGLMVTPRDIDRQVADLSKLLGYGISLALQPRMTVAELELLLG